MPSEDTPNKSAIKIHSDIHETVGDIIECKDTTLRDNCDAIERRQVVHAFTNLRDTMTEEEQNEAGREEIVNFGSTYRSAHVNIAPLESIVVGTDSLCDVTVDMNDPNTDHLIAVEIANAANDWFFTNNEKFNQLWRTAVGEGYLTGGGPLIWDDKDSGLYPRYNRHFFFPKGTSLDPSEMTYAFERRQMTIGDIEAMLEAADEDEDYISKSSIEAMLETIRDQIRSNTNYHSYERTSVYLDDDNSARDEGIFSRTKFDAWIYWEVRTYEEGHKKEGQKYVTKIVFVDGCTLEPEKNNSGKPMAQYESYEAKAVLVQDKVAFDDPRDWLVMLVWDEEIGGEKTVDTLRGVAEAYYKSAVLIEELKNVQIEAAITTAKPVLQEEEGADPDEILDFQLGDDAFMPKRVNFVDIPNRTNQISPIVADLMQTVSGISGAGISNTGRGQELRQQALERQDNNSIIKNNKVLKGYMKADILIDYILGRGLTMNPEAGTEDCRLIKGFQECVDQKIIEVYKIQDQSAEGLVITEEPETAKSQAAKIRKKIGERNYGKFKYIKAKARRNATGLDRPSEVDNARFILEMVQTGRVPAQNVPLLLERAAAYQTQNADIAALLTNKPEPISAEQQERAAAEFDTIRRRASVGDVLSVGARDIDEDHIEAHLTDITAFVNSHGLRPWDQLAVAEFTAVIQHIAEHIERMRQKPESAGTSRQMMAELQEVVKQAGGIIQVLEEQKQAQQNEELSPDDRLKLAKEQKTYAEIEMLGRKLGIEIADKRDIMRGRVIKAQQNEDRAALMNRQQLVNEIKADREFQLKKQQLNESTNQDTQ